MNSVAAAIIKERLDRLAGDSPTVGRCIQAAWDEGLLVTGCVGAADGARLAPMYDDDAARDQTAATTTMDLPAAVTPPWDANCTGETYKGYRAMLAIMDTRGQTQAIVWTERPATVILDHYMADSRQAGAWDAPWDARRQAGRADIESFGIQGTLDALVADGWDRNQAADWLLEAAIGVEFAGAILLWPDWASKDRLITVDEEAYLRSVAGRYYDPKAELVGRKEAAEILGWDGRRVSTYISRGTFPKPVAELAMGPVWTRRQIEEYARRFRKSGEQ